MSWISTQWTKKANSPLNTSTDACTGTPLCTLDSEWQLHLWSPYTATIHSSTQTDRCLQIKTIPQPWLPKVPVSNCRLHRPPQHSGPLSTCELSRETGIDPTSPDPELPYRYVAQCLNILRWMVLILVWLQSFNYCVKLNCLISARSWQHSSGIMEAKSTSIYVCRYQQNSEHILCELIYFMHSGLTEIIETF